ncbi:uncharacterized protein LOC129569232 [Sitodiplosis mosellana]|uniref:uncharacterized protein LOC129569232 n=1 Tax=Sitodiplosis mosellana TaxID=263140 RepID=UPI002444B9FE|nr:uncharacterized protein LOC129569232 [Sitodiplosis mosellana]
MALQRFIFVSLTVVLTLVVLFHKAFAIKCWRCQSSGKMSEFCKDPFVESNITAAQKRWIYVDCPQNSNQRSACKKIIQLVNDKVVISRSCHFEPVNALENDCMNETTPSYVKTQFCKSCLTDGCNGGAMNVDFENEYTTVASENTIDD